MRTGFWLAGWLSALLIQCFVDHSAVMLAKGRPADQLANQSASPAASYLWLQGS